MRLNYDEEDKVEVQKPPALSHDTVFFPVPGIGCFLMHKPFAFGIR